MPWEGPPAPYRIETDRLVIRCYEPADAREEREQLGGTSLHARVGLGGLEIGYFVRASATRQGIATEVAAVLTSVGFEVCEADHPPRGLRPRDRAAATSLRRARASAPVATEA